MRTATALIVAAGRGLRAGGGVPKQWRTLHGRAVAAHAAAAFAGRVDALIAVIHPDDRAAAEAALPGILLVVGGDTRAASVAAGLAAVGTDLVLIHDGARPLVPGAVIDRVRAALEAGASGAAPALAVTDALWSGSATVEAVRPRDGLWRAQTPQGFRTAAIRAAHDRAGPAASDDVEVALAAGMEVRIVPRRRGEPEDHRGRRHRPRRAGVGRGHPRRQRLRRPRLRAGGRGDALRGFGAP